MDCRRPRPAPVHGKRREATHHHNIDKKRKTGALLISEPP